jgi:hypothetical protein
MVTAVGYRWFPETVGMELEDSAPEIEDLGEEGTLAAREQPAGWPHPPADDADHDTVDRPT